MPDYSDTVCVKRGNITYCWNTEICQLEIYTKRICDMENCPKDVANEITLILSDKLKKKGKK